MQESAMKAMSGASDMMGAMANIDMSQMEGKVREFLTDSLMEGLNEMDVGSDKQQQITEYFEGKLGAGMTMDGMPPPNEMFAEIFPGA